MPLIPASMQMLSQAKAGSTVMAGSKLPSFVSAISSAACQYILASSVVNSTNIVTGPGVGTQTGTIVGLVPSAMSSLMLMNAASSGISGRDTQKLFDAISTGVCNSMQTVVLQGTVIGGAIGVGTGKIIGLVPTVLSGIIMANMGGQTLAGSKLFSIVSAISFGICNHILANAVVNITNVGVPSPPPAGPIPIPAAPGIGTLC